MPAGPPQPAQHIDLERFSIFMEDLIVLASKHGFGIVTQTKLRQEPYGQSAHLGFLQMPEAEDVAVDDLMRARIRGSFFAAEQFPTLEVTGTTTLAEIAERFQQLKAAPAQDIRAAMRAMTVGPYLPAQPKDEHGS